ncbi:MAG: hypothetical protein HQL90_07820 [Magnetococcales bacterium]|nr:hypothetical protein [Magnetococcales bacterium]
MTARKWIEIPIVEQGSNRVVGGFCSTLDAVSAAELEALRQLKRLRAEAEQVKQQLQTQSGEERERLTRRLEALRQEAAVWRNKREQATLEKHLALGHVTLSVQSL